MSRIAEAVAAAAVALLPPPLKRWGEAMRHEVAAIRRPAAAILFSLGCLGFALRQKAMFHLLGDTATMRPTDLPRRLTGPCAIAATGLGLAYMAAGGAPPSYFVINFGALALAFASLPLARAVRAPTRIVNLLLGAGLLLLTLVGVSVDGATRWISVAGLAVQPSLILLPVLAVGFARHRDRVSLAGTLLAAFALALQPDRAMAGALAAALLALAMVRSDRIMLAAMVGGAAAFAAALLQPDVQGAMPFVDQILYTSFAVHPLAGAAVWLGAALLLVPAAVGLAVARDRAPHAAFGALWLGAIVAAALGNYPTPLVGYGGSAIVGYLLCLLALPRGVQAAGPGEGTRPAAPAPRTERLSFIPFPPTGKPC